ncbi:MAG: hypothetical protein WBY94_16425, partial [Polyangiaceae bacterium]
HSPNTELHSPNTELHSPNTELHSPNTELHSSNTELHSPNTELHSSNAELHSSNTELRLRTNGLRGSDAFVRSRANGDDAPGSEPPSKRREPHVPTTNLRHREIEHRSPTTKHLSPPTDLRDPNRPGNEARVVGAPAASAARYCAIAVTLPSKNT